MVGIVEEYNKFCRNYKVLVTEPVSEASSGAIKSGDSALGQKRSLETSPSPILFDCVVPMKSCQVQITVMSNTLLHFK